MPHRVLSLFEITALRVTDYGLQKDRRRKPRLALRRRHSETQHKVVAGFWLGLWQGFIAPFAFVVSLFKDNLGIYEVHNNGGWYNLGYLFGLACFFGGGGKQAARGTRSLKPSA